MGDPTKAFSKLRVWHDELPRSGFENMAVDQLLMESCGDIPTLRIYQWSEPTVSFGYFNSLEGAKSTFSGNITYVRRWTGGGVVDHRCDVTYTLAIPRSHELACTHGAESYKVIHQALADVLQLAGENVRLTTCCEGDGGSQCFTNPVAYDLTDLAGRKIAGAGQRRSRYGLLHQGSVIPQLAPDVFRGEMLEGLGNQLAEKCEDFQPAQKLLAEAVRLAGVRYASQAWLGKR